MADDPSPIGYIDAPILFNRALPGNHAHLRLQAPDLAKAAQPGHFVHILCDPCQTLRRPFSFLDADPEAGWIDILYKIVGEGTALLAAKKEGETVSVMGPIGTLFSPPKPDETSLFIAGGIGLAPMDFLARRLKRTGATVELFLGLEGDSPFHLADNGAERTVHRLDKVSIPSQVASLTEQPGFFHGFVTELARTRLEAMTEEERKTTRLYACGPTPMMKAAAALAAEYGLPGEASLEEHMACGFGACAGCSAPIREEGEGDAWNYKRVCVDGPVFSMDQVAWERY